MPRTVIAELFGEDVAKLVEEVTDDKSLEKQERKWRQVEHAAQKSDRAKILKLADKTSNLRAIAASPPPDWSVKRRLDYVKWACDVAKGLTGVSDWLEQEFNQAAKEAQRSTVFLLCIDGATWRLNCGQVCASRGGTMQGTMN